MKALSIELATGELKALLYALELAASLNDDTALNAQIRNVHRKVTKNVKDI